MLRCFMHCTIAVLLCLCLVPSVGAAESPPNFVIFYVDDLGWADTSVRMMDDEPLSASDFYQTPALERLAKQGMRFTSGYAPTPTCTGSRISIQFGMTSARLQYRNVFDVLSKKQRPRGWDDEVSMAAVVKAADKNYVTAHFGKGMSVRRMDHAGYDVTDEFDRGPNGNGHGSYIDVNKKVPIPDDNPKRIVDLTRRSVEFVREHAGKRPFFLMVSHYAVHIPHQASPAAIESCRRRWVAAGNPDVGPDDKEYKKHFPEWRYAAMIEETDASLGAILDALKKSKGIDNTYVIFTSDNGGGHGRRDEAGNRFQGPLQEGKRSTYEGGLRVPFIVSGPGIKPGSQCDVPVVQWDLLPTLHDLSGSSAPLPAGVDGGSLRDVFERGDDGVVPRNAPGLVFHYPCHYHPPISVIRIGNYKLMRHLNSGDVKLFNVATDYAEQQDLAQQLPEKVKEMDRILKRYVDEVDGGQVSEVYAAYFEWLDAELQRKEERHQRDVDSLKQRNPPDLEEQLAKLEAELQAARRQHATKTAICEDQMTNPSWRETRKNEVVEEIGIDKKGNVIVPKTEKPPKKKAAKVDE
ncbi:sulfatase [Novipirellula artificiosorum]|uniref:Choline-sulfatase n=1 Tax=Novipirellula artificiosorum TaxID=2528016 RepID=A0A5C6DV62_9BACT|nr:sulfatase [Novipirellula artificiosorum]TWU40580.1 Choline-sulfatase [Novipirellula artificiosorum]